MDPSCLLRIKHKFLSVVYEALYPSSLTFLPMPSQFFAPGAPNHFRLPSPFPVAPFPIMRLLCASVSVCSVYLWAGTSVFSTILEWVHSEIQLKCRLFWETSPDYYSRYMIEWVKGASALLLGPSGFHPTHDNSLCLQRSPLEAPIPNTPISHSG